MPIINKTSLKPIECPAKLKEDINNNIKISAICEDITVNNDVEISFSFSKSLSIDENAELDLLISNLSCTTNILPITNDQLEGGLYTITFSYPWYALNKWMYVDSGNSLFSNSTFSLIPFDSKLQCITFSNYKVDLNVDFKLYKFSINQNPSDMVNIYTLSVNDNRTYIKSDFGSDIILNKGDKLGIYMKRTSSSRSPKQSIITLYMQIITYDSNDVYERFEGKMK